MIFFANATISQTLSRSHNHYTGLLSKRPRNISDEPSVHTRIGVLRFNLRIGESMLRSDLKVIQLSSDRIKKQSEVEWIEKLFGINVIPWRREISKN